MNTNISNKNIQISNEYLQNEINKCFICNKIKSKNEWVFSYNNNNEKEFYCSYECYCKSNRFYTSW